MASSSATVLGNFERLPLEIINHIFTFLHPNDAAKLGRINRLFYLMSSNESIWKTLFAMYSSSHSHLELIEHHAQDTGISYGIRYEDLIQNAQQIKFDNRQFFWKSQYISTLQSMWIPPQNTKLIQNLQKSLRKNKLIVDKYILIAVVGNSGVGKSCSTVQYVQNIFVENYDPNIEDSYRRYLSLFDIPFILEILDTAGTDQFVAMRDLYVRPHSHIVMYSLIDRSTFIRVEDYIDQAMRNCGSFVGILVGNKCDLASERKVGFDEGLEVAKKYNCAFLETSAKTRFNLEKAFELAGLEALKFRYERALQEESQKKRKCVMM